MPRLPIPNADADQWGALLNEFLRVSHHEDGTPADCVHTIADLKALTTGSVACLLVLGYYARGDGGGGTFYWDAASVEADNGGTVISPNANLAVGRWKRPTMDVTSAKTFGTVGDGIADDASAIQRAIDATPATGGIVFFPRGVYKINTEIVIRNRGKIKLSGVPTRLDDISELSGSCIQRVGVGPALTIESESGSERVGIWIDGLHIRANGAGQPVVRVSRMNKVHITNTVITGGAAYGLLLERVAGMTMIDTRIDACGIGIKSAEITGNYLNNFAAYRCEFANNSTAGVEIQGGGLGFFACNFEGQQIGARISAVPAAGALSQAVSFQNCYFEGNTVQALELGYAAGVSGLTVSGCYFLLQVGTPRRYIHLVAKGFVIEGNSFNAGNRGGEPFPSEQILMENCHNGRIGANAGLVPSGITDLSGNSQITIENEGSARVGHRVVNANATVMSTDYIIAAAASEQPLRITLPSAVGYKGRVIIIKKLDALGNSVQVMTVNGQTIDGAVRSDPGGAMGGVASRVRWYKLASRVEVEGPLGYTAMAV